MSKKISSFLGIDSDVISCAGVTPTIPIDTYSKCIISSISVLDTVAQSLTVSAPVDIGCIFGSTETQPGLDVQFASHNIALTLTGDSMDSAHTNKYTGLKGIDFAGKNSKLIISSNGGSIKLDATIDSSSGGSHGTIEIKSDSSVEFKGAIGQHNPICDLHIQKHASSTLTMCANFSNEIIIGHGGTLVVTSGATVGTSEHPVGKVVLAQGAILNVEGELYTRELVAEPGSTITNSEHVHVILTDVDIVGGHHDIT